MRHITFLAILLALGACGTRGGLTLLPGPTPAPILGNPAPAKPKPATTSEPSTPATTGNADLSTAQEAK
ncbi:MAG: hypothetical protein H6943_03165 [Zoogloeaceae bacterium]|nr:hypothetical protein [Zoogloeaceae bacterium]